MSTPGIAAGLVTDNGSGVISDSASSLTGVVRAPASIITNNGGSLVANNGGNVVSNNAGNIIANNGGGLRLLMASDQVPLAGRSVSLVDAAGKPVLDTSGKPLTATTDAAGRYAFKAKLPLHNLLLRVDLQKAGTLEAIAPRGSVKADVDLVSTLTSSYILAKYVKSQADPIATLEKLPSDVEATTRQFAADALAKDAAAAPAAFTDVQVVATVERLRKQDTVFNQQLELVKKLLVVAGQSDLGAGQLGTEVTISDVVAMAPGPDGSVYLDSQNDSRVWRLTSDGHLLTAVGNGTPTIDSVDGVLGVNAGIASPLGMSVDDKGRLILVENSATGNTNSANVGLFSRITRLETNGTLTQLWAGGSDMLANVAVPGPGGRVFFVLTTGNLGPPMGSPDGTPNVAELWSVGDDKQARLEHKFVGAAALAMEGVSNYSPFGVDEQGRVILNTFDMNAPLTESAERDPTLYALDLKTFSLTEIGRTKGSLGPSLTIDAMGHVLLRETPIALIKPDGTHVPILGGPGADAFVESALLLPDGTDYFAVAKGVLRLKDGISTSVVGGKNSGTSATSVTLDNMGGLTSTPDGNLLVAANNQILKLANKKLTPIVGVANPSYSAPIPDSGPALSAALWNPGTVRVGLDGQIYFFDANASTLLKLDAAGMLSTVATTKPGSTMIDYAVAADGTLFLEVDNPAAAVDPAATTFPDPLPPGYIVQRRAAGSPPETVAFCTNSGSLILDTSGALTIVGDGKVRRWTRAGGVVSVIVDSRLDNVTNFSSQCPAFDAKGRLYVPVADLNLIYQIDLASHAFKIIAGPGSTHFAGSGVDASLLNPHCVTFTPNGDLYIGDFGHKQVKRIPAGEF